MTIGQFIKKNRTEKKLTQAQFCEQIGMCSRQLRRYENGEIIPRLDKLVHILYHLGIEIKAAK